MTRLEFLGLPGNKWILLLIIILGAALRFFYLGSQSIWYDEAVSLAIADRLSLWEVLTNQGQSSHPPLYYLLLRAWIRGVEINDFTTRIPSTAAGILTIPLIYQAGRRLLNKTVGLWGAFFIAVFPFHVYYAQEARMYTLLAMLTTLSLIFFLKAVENNQWYTWGGYGLSLALSLYTHYFIAFVILAYHLYLLLNWRRYLHFWKPVIITDFLLLLIFLPQVANFLSQSQEVFKSYWLGKPSPLAFFTTIYFFVASYTVPPRLTFIGLFVLLSWLAIGLYDLYRQTKFDRDQRMHFYLLGLGAFLPLLSALAISQIRPIFLERTLIVCTPFLVLLLAWILASSRRHSPIPYLAGIMGVVLVLSLYRYYFDPAVHKPPMRQAAAHINAVIAPNDIVLHTSVGSFMPFLFYQPPAEHYLLWGDPDPRKSATTFELFGGKIATLNDLGRYRRLWLVVVLDHSIEYQHNQVSWFDEHFPLVKETKVGGIIIRQYRVTK
ncbi:glycosyltransferase family 39 protein [Chloroflexota bacterium]